MIGTKSFNAMYSRLLLLIIIYCCCVLCQGVFRGQCNDAGCNRFATDHEANKEHIFCNRMYVHRNCLKNLTVICSLPSNDTDLRKVQSTFLTICQNHPVYKNYTLEGPEIQPPLTCMHPGKKKFTARYCEFYNNLNLKTFKKWDQICQFEGKRMLIDNSYMSVEVITGRIQGSKTIFPVKFSVVVKDFGPCLTEKRYEAFYNSSLPSTFSDGSTQSIANHTFVSKTESHLGHKETGEIIIEYINAKVIIQREGILLGIRAAIPRSLFRKGDVERRDKEYEELCHTGCLID